MRNVVVCDFLLVRSTINALNRSCSCKMEWGRLFVGLLQQLQLLSNGFPSAEWVESSTDTYCLPEAKEEAELQVLLEIKEEYVGTTRPAFVFWKEIPAHF